MNLLKPAQPTILVGRVKPLPNDGHLSGIDKQPVPGPWQITRTGLIGDAQADLNNHGGVDKWPAAVLRKARSAGESNFD